jgi:hypothetical protein
MRCKLWRVLNNIDHYIEKPEDISIDAYLILTVNERAPDLFERAKRFNEIVHVSDM